MERGAHVLDVNAGLPDIDETAMLSRVVFELQSVCGLPLQIDTSSPEAMEAALRIYNGKPMINSVCGKRESMESVFPLAAKYPKRQREGFRLHRKFMTLQKNMEFPKKILLSTRWQ